MADDNQVIDAPQGDDVAMAAFAAIYDPPKQEDSAPPAPAVEAAPQDPPQDANSGVAADTPDEPAEAAPGENAAPVADLEPAKQPTDSPELSAKLQEADKTKQEAEAVRSKFLNALNTLVPQLESRLKGEFADIKTMDDLRALANPASDRYNPDRYNAYVIAQAELQQANMARDEAARQEQQTQAQRHREWQAAEQQKLGKLIPELNDPEKGPVLAKKLQEYAVKNGVTPEQMSKASANDFVIIHRAMQFDNLQAQQKIAREKAANAPPVQKPGVKAPTASKEDKIQENFERLQRNPDSTDAAAALFRQILN